MPHPHILAFFLLVASLSAAEIFELDQIDPNSIDQSSGEAKIGRSVDDQEITMGGVIYQKGIGTHANSRIAFSLDGKAEEFNAIVGASDRQKGTASTLIFSIHGDDQLIWTSGILTPESSPLPVVVNLKSIKKLVLTVNGTADGTAHDHANWANAFIRYSGKVPQAEDESILIETKSLSLRYKPIQDGTLHLHHFGMKDGSYRSPFSGPAYPGSTDCPQFPAPIAISRLNGDPALNLIYQKHTTTENAPGILHHIITLKDRIDEIIVELHLTAFVQEDTLEQSIIIRNELPDPLHVHQLSSAFWHAPASINAHLEHYPSSHKKEAATPIIEKITPGQRTLTTHTGIRHLEGTVPAIVMSFGAAPDERKTPCLISSLAWSGPMDITANLLPGGNLTTQMAAQFSHQPYTLAPNSSLQSPKAIFTLSPSGKGHASRNLHSWTRHHGMRDAHRLRLIANHSSEAYGFEVDEPIITEMIQNSAKLGIELVVLDEGWCGNGATARTNATSGLGDWQINTQRFPNGIPHLVQTAKEAAINFGLTLQPEVVNPRSELFTLHPHWLLRHPDREIITHDNQLLLDLTQPEVRKFVFSSIDHILTENPNLRLIQWNNSADLFNPYSHHLGPTQQGKLIQQYLEGLESSLKALSQKYPNIDFQINASGAGRANHSALLHAHGTTLSENTHPIYQLRALWNFSTFLPTIATASRVTYREDFKPKFLFDVSMNAQLSLSIDPARLPPQFKDATTTAIETYKSIREIVQFGNQHRHLSPFESDLPSLNYVSQDQTKSLVLAYQLGYYPDLITTQIPVHGLHPDKIYQISEINLPIGDQLPRLQPQASLPQTGRKWMEHGIPLVFHRNNDSAAILLSEASTP